jgi:hypothetical protein
MENCWAAASSIGAPSGGQMSAATIIKKGTAL